MSNQTQAIILMGVSGCGKTSVGKELSRTLGWPFFDGDDYHPQENVAKMASGIPLDDADRSPWLTRLHDLIAEHLEQGQSLILACSALKQKYRDQLMAGNPGSHFVYLKGDFNLILRRMGSRSEHYMKAEMLRSQFDALEEPTQTLTVEIEKDLDLVVKEILDKFKIYS